MSLRSRFDNFVANVFGGAIARAMSAAGYSPAQQSADDGRGVVATFPGAAGGAKASDASRVDGRTFAGGRQSVDDASDLFNSTLAIFAPLSSESQWRALNLDSNALDKIKPSKLIELLADLSPEVSRALYDGLLMCNPGVEITATNPGTETPNPRAQKALDDILHQLRTLYGATDVLYDQLFISLFLRGACCGELVLDFDGQTFVDIARPDPATMSFKKSRDPVRGVVWQVGQWQGGRFVVLDGRETFRYVPLHPLPGKIQGRAPFSSALFVAVFLMSVLRDLRRVIQQQGFDKVDVTVLLDKIRASMSNADQNNPQEVTKVANDIISAVKGVYSQLQPDDAYVHTDAVTVNRAQGAANASTLGAVDALFKALERMATRALKTMPLLMASTEGASEANANRQFEMYAKGMSILQHRVEALLEHLFSLALQAQGLLAQVNVKFAELRAAEAMRDAQTEEKTIANANSLYEQGVISQDERAKRTTGKDKADQPAPRTPAAQQTRPTRPEADPEPGANRMPGGTRTAPSTTAVESSVTYWQHIAPAAAQDLPTAVGVN
jgi:hypothetical protein